MESRASEPASMPAAATALAEVLFTPVQQKVLGLLFGQPGRRYQSAELIRFVDSGTGSVHRFLTRLADVGLVDTTMVGNQKFYQANPDSPVFAEIAGLVRKTVGLVGPIQAGLAPMADRIVAAFVYGSIAKGKDRADSDIDLLVISDDDDLDYADLYALLPTIEAVLARTVDVNLMGSREWQRKRREADGFVARIAAQPKLFVIGAEDDLA